MAKPDPVKFVSILQDVTTQIQNTPGLSLDQAKEMVTEAVTSSGIKDEDKAKILKNLEDPTIHHVMPLSMKDQSSLLTYLYNSILKYKGLGVIKKQEGEVREVDPNEENSGYGGDRPGVWVTPKATLNQDVGILPKGTSVVITSIVHDKLAFYVEQDITLVGIAPKNLFTIVQASPRLQNYVRCHSYLAKVPKLLNKIAEELVLPDTLVQELETIRTNMQTSKDNFVNTLPASPNVLTSARLADAAEFFTLAGKVPTREDTLAYLQASIESTHGIVLDNKVLENMLWAANLGFSKQSTPSTKFKVGDRVKCTNPEKGRLLPHLVNTKSEGTVILVDRDGVEVKFDDGEKNFFGEHELSKVASTSSSTDMQWVDKLLTLSQRHQAGQLPEDQWQQVLTTMDEGDLNDLRVLVDRLSQDVAKTSDILPPAPTNPPMGKKYIWDASNKSYVLVDAAKKKV